jgi:hypothetical protein
VWALFDTGVHEGVARKALTHDAPVFLACLGIANFGLSEDKDLGSLVSEAAVETLVLLRADTPGVPGCYGEG